MSTPMITVEGLGKRYTLGRKSSLDLRSGIGTQVRSLFRGKAPEFWAVRNINFTVPEGQVVGVVGRNGAGKSTLLKLLSRITYPTEGRFRIRGQLSALLEVGTGFHGELTGRENVYLNGTILGMRRAEVRAKFDEIAAFSGVERFLDTPVKHYSSGQKVRLAFAVAAHLEPEVLLIDEVLAVGDAEFQRKSVGKMRDVASNGRTVLFVSHNMSAVNSICHQCILLDQGEVEMIGPTSEVTGRYLMLGEDEHRSSKDVSHMPLQKDHGARVLQLRWIGTHGHTIDHATITEPFGLEITYEVLKDGLKPHPALRLHNAQGEQVFTSTPGPVNDLRFERGIHTVTVHLPADLLAPGAFHATVWLLTWSPHQPHQVLENIMHLTVLDHPDSPTYPMTDHKLGGVIRPNLRWEVHR